MDTPESISCNQCEALMINGLFCHETGCPNSRKRFENGEWVLYLKCFECGCDVREGESCSCQDPPEPTKHWIAGAGLHGCLFNHCAILDSYDAAVDNLAQVHELGRTRKATLKRAGYLELNLKRDGNEYCEITECDCATPEVHQD